MTYKYQSDGTAFIAGVPARDLTDAEFEALPKEQKEECIKSGLYAPEGLSDPQPVLSGEIDLADGVNEAEASLAGKTLSIRGQKGK